MTRLKPFLRNLVSHVLNVCIIVACFIYGCSPSTKSTYRKENIAEAIQNICKNEYQIDARAKLVGETLWIYLPVEDMFVKSEKPEKYVEKFIIEHNDGEFQNGSLRLEYLITPTPEKEKYQTYKYNKQVLEKMNNVWKVLRRVIFSMERLKEGEPKFFCLVIADIRNAFETREIFYYLDLKKVSYAFISWSEYQHRAVQESNISLAIIGDKEGVHVNYSDITLKDFILKQIDHRIKLKFQKPEVDKDTDIDKEIIKIIAHTIKAYSFKDFTAAELNNLLTNKKIILNQGELASPIK